MASFIFTQDKWRIKLSMLKIICVCQLMVACGGGGGSSLPQQQPPVFIPSPHPQQIYVDFAEQAGLQQTGLAFLLNQSGVTNARLLQDTGLEDRDYLTFDADTFELISDVNINDLQLFTDISDTLDVFQTFDDPFTNWESNGRRNLNQKILILTPGEDGIGLSYSTLGYWVDAIAAKPTVGTIIWGVPVATLQIPTMGSANYSGLMRGFMTGEGQTWELHADFDATVNFGNGAFSGQFTNGTRIDMQREDGTFFSSHVTDQELPDLIRTPENFNDTFDWSLSGSIVSGQNLFSGTLAGTGDGSDWAGQFSGSFFGSGRTGAPEELSGLWNAINNLGHVAGGAFVGKDD